MKLNTSLISLSLALALGTACRSAPETQVVRGELRPDLVGNYDGPNHGGPLLLELRADGTYECLVLLYISSFGCGDVIGNGASSGDWFTVGDALRFDVQRESKDMELSLVDSTAVIGDGRLDLAIGDRSFTLVRADQER